MSLPPASSYKAAGVDLDVAEQLVTRLKPLAAATRTAGVESNLGSFGGFFAFPEVGGRQLLVASIDGVGTKMKVARMTGNWENAGYDIVAHCCDDILVHGAQPLFFLDYVGMGKLDGLGPFGLLWHVIVPMATPAIAALSSMRLVASRSEIGRPSMRTRSTYRCKCGEANCPVRHF